MNKAILKRRKHCATPLLFNPLAYCKKVNKVVSDTWKNKSVQPVQIETGDESF